jgi:hypothetical protein
MRVTASLAIAGLLCALSCAEAATVPVCTTQGARDTKTLTFDPRDGDTLKGLGYAIVLFPPGSPLSRPCLRAKFTVDGDAFVLLGEGAASVVRIAAPRDYRKRAVVLDGMPAPKAALKWLRDNPTGQYVDIPAKDVIYALILFSAEKRQTAIYRFYDRIPRDRELVTAACDALSGSISPLFTVDMDHGLPKVRPVKEVVKPVRHADCHASMSATTQ